MIDTHVHLDDEKLLPIADEVVQQFTEQGVKLVINNSCDLQTMTKGIELAEKYSNVYCTVGMHPHTASQMDSNFLDKLTSLASHPKVVAVGEIGLDYYYDLSERNVQRDVFAMQLEYADKLKLPVTLHIRDAYGDALDVLNAQNKFLNQPIVWHCYSGSAEFARQMVKKGHYFAFGGAITFKNANKQSVIDNIPIDRILTETDCPYMTPVPFRGKTNMPQFVRYVVEKLALMYNVSFNEMERRTEQNCFDVFGKIDRSKYEQ